MADVSSGRLYGVVRGGTHARAVTGRVGKALRVVGDTWIDLDRHAAALGAPDSFTLSMWVQYFGGPSRILFSWSDGTLKHRIQLEVHDGRLHFGWQNGGPWRGFGTPKLLWTYGQWYHVAFVNDRAKGKRIIRSNDGVSVAHPDTLGPAGLSTGVARVQIGALNGAYRFNGSVDDVQLADTALGDDEIRALYTDVPAPAPRPVMERPAWSILFVRGWVPLQGRGEKLHVVRVGRSTSRAEHEPDSCDWSRAHTMLDMLTPPALGNQLCRLNLASAQAQPRVLVDAGVGMIGPATVSHDGGAIFFSMKPAGEPFFQIHRISADGDGLRALTAGPFQHVDPEPLGDGRIAFSSSRLGCREEYHGTRGGCLFSMNADGSDIRLLTPTILSDTEPKATADGRIAFARKDVFAQQGKNESAIHVVRPDGSGGVNLLSADRPALGYDRRLAAEQNARWLRFYGFGCPAPLPDGRVAALSNYGLVVSGSGASVPRRVPAPFTPFDISAVPDGRLLCTAPGLRTIGVLDLRDGGFVPLFSSTERPVHAPVYLGRRPRPPTLATCLPPSPSGDRPPTGTLACRNVLLCRQTNVDTRRIKAVRIWEGRPFALTPTRADYVHVGAEAVELGTVPLAPDGSFCVRVPADRALAIQAVDAAGRSIIQAMTYVYVRPGERRSCVGCHEPRHSAPAPGGRLLASRAPLIALLGQGRPPRFRANVGGRGGMINLQFDRARECSSIDLYTQEALAPGDGGGDHLAGGRASVVRRLCTQLAGGSTVSRVSGASRLGILRDTESGTALAEVLRDECAEVRLAAAMALAGCGTRGTIPRLLATLDDAHPLVAQAAHVALEYLTGQAVDFDPFAPGGRRRGNRDWRERLAEGNWRGVVIQLIDDLSAADPVKVRNAIEALGHVGGEGAATALRSYIAESAGRDLRTTMAAMRALGVRRDASAVPFLARVLAENARRGPDRIDFIAASSGRYQVPVYLAGTAAEALGRIGTSQAEAALIAAFAQLRKFWFYTLRCGDHEWLKGCYSSVPHFRILEALDAMGSRVPPSLVPVILRSVPLDTDRALLFGNDAYETLVARVVERSGKAAAVMETCLSVLGDPTARAEPLLKQAVTTSPPARETGPLCAEARAAQIAAVVCLERRFAPRLRGAFVRYRVTAEERRGAWASFFLARSLGQLRDPDSVDDLLTALDDGVPEARLGYEAFPRWRVYRAMSPFHRAAAAYSLGRIGDRRAVAALLRAAADLDNAVGVRHAAAMALQSLCDASDLPRLRSLTETYPEVTTRHVLQEACRRAKGRGE